MDVCVRACPYVCLSVYVRVCVCVNIKEYTYLTREVWPDDVFGTGDMDVVEQRDVLKKIFLDPVSGNYVSVCVNVYLHIHLCIVYHALVLLIFIQN